MYRLALLSLSLGITLYANDMENESLEDIMGMQSELKADVGSRSGSKSTFFNSTPVDVISYEEIDNSGLTLLTDVLKYFVAGFNTQDITSIGDGSSFVRSWTLRGMSPDQVLVLVNGKRLHTSSLLHLNSLIGRGASNVDLDTIPLISIEKIEILRDGAAAQYGSDAIAGVINIKLKGIGHENSIRTHVGKRSSGDGEQLSVQTFINTPLKYDGFLNFTLSVKDQEKTDNSGIDSRDGVLVPRHTTPYGIVQARDYLASINIEAPQDNDTVLYFNAFANSRDSISNAFYRPPSSSSSPLYSNGFLPLVHAKIFDISTSFGASGRIKDIFSWDISNTYGYNKIDFIVNDTMNYTLGANSPTSFDNGGLRFTQNTTNLDLVKDIDTLSLAGGIEYRYEKYEIVTGEVASYFGTGTQGLGGYRNSVNESRTNYALYLDVKYTPSKHLSLGASTRYEDFSDFGDTSNVKVDVAYKSTPKFLLRTSASTGFRAPSLAQSNYSYITSFLNNGSLSNGGIFTPDDEVSKSFNAKALKAETSKHFALGSAYSIDDDTFFSIDYFYINVADKIMLSPSLQATSAEQIALFNSRGLSKASFFTNAVDTRTQGIDIKFNTKYTLENSSKLSTSIWYNYNTTKVTHYHTQSVTEENSIQSINEIENGQPKSSLKVLNTYEHGAFTTILNLSWFDSYQDVRNDTAYTFKPVWITDLNIIYKVSKQMRLSLGANNIFNIRPNKWDGLEGSYVGSNGIVPYSTFSPIGTSGAYYYARATLEF